MMKKIIVILIALNFIFIGCEKTKERKINKQVENKQQLTKYSKIEITDVIYENGKVNITGISDLPDGSELIISLDVANRPANAPSISESTTAIIENGKFSAIIAPPKHPEFNKGPHLVSVLFTPRGKAKHILDLVGNDGENLTGDKAGRTHAFKYLETEKQINLQLKKISYPIINADSYPVNSPEKALLEFLSSWKQKDWNMMKKFTQKSWIETQKNSAEMLEGLFGFKQLLGAKIVSKDIISDVAVDIIATIYYSIGSDIAEKNITAKIIRENAPFTPSSSGDWGINPTSILKEE
jgi:hypothetical protein